MTDLNKVFRLDCAPLKEIYVLIDQVRSDELQAANRKTAVAFTRLRAKLSRIAKLCKSARKELLAMRDEKKHGKNAEMEKYGVYEEQEAKIAASTPEIVRCPRCGSIAERHGIVYKCPQHGTEPFESKE